MGVLSGLQPEPVFIYFEEICGIPHTSYHEKQLSDYMIAFAQKRGLFCTQDEMGNVLIVSEATPGYEDAEPVMIQGHLDMVGDKTENCSINLEKEGVQLYIDGDYIRAKGTTLGGDDGIAIAYALAILDSDHIPHPRLEAVFTVCEEVGLLGATAMDFSMCKARRLINIDSEEEGVLTAGCAGGRRAHCHIPVKRQSCEGIACTFSLEGLLGGHSGTEIDKGRANANVLLGHFLMLLKDKVPYQLMSLNGGVKENVIPKSGKTVIVTDEAYLSKVKEIVEEFHIAAEAEFGTADPDIRLVMTTGEYVVCQALTDDSLDTIISSLNLMPNGIQAMSMDLPGLVETSLNLGVMELKEEELELRISIRSSVAPSKEYIAKKIALLVKQLGGYVDFTGDYPAWPYARQSKLRDRCIEIFKAQYGYEPAIQTMHAGLECGILSGKLEGLDCISFGPDLIDVHTPNEHMSISSVARVWEYLKAILADK